MSINADDEEISFSKGAKDGAEARFPTGTLDLFETADFTINCTAVSLLDQIAKGSYGTVYKGSMNGITCAVKIEDFHEEDEEQVNLLVELSMLQSFPHRNLVKYHGAGILPRSATGEKMIMIVMELCKYGALRDCLKFKLPWNLLTRICIDVATGLSVLHDNGIIHRDIKSTNILVDDEWTAKLCDFSFACSVESQTKTNFIYGTDEFMSPEIALAMDFDQAADIFSFGLVICELITGKEPSSTFLCRKPNNMFALNEQELRDAVLPGCPDLLEALALECCNVDPTSRPNAHICVEELEGILHALGGYEFQFHLSPSVTAAPRLPYASPDREGHVKYPGRESFGGGSPSSPRGGVVMERRDPNTRLSYLEVQLQGLKAENTRMNRDMQTLISIISSRMFSEPGCSPSPGLSLSPVTGRSKSASSSSAQKAATSKPSGRGDVDMEGSQTKSKNQQRLLRRMSAAVGRGTNDSFDALSMSDLGPHSSESAANLLFGEDGHGGGVSRSEMEAAVSTATQTMLVKFYELEKRLEDSVGPIERLARSSNGLTPQKSEEKIVGKSPENAADDLSAVDIAITAHQNIKPFVVAAAEGDAVALSRPVPSSINQIDLHSAEDIKHTIDKLNAMEHDIYVMKSMLTRQLREVDPTHASDDDDDAVSVDIDLRMDENQTFVPNTSMRLNQEYSSSAGPYNTSIPVGYGSTSPNRMPAAPTGPQDLARNSQIQSPANQPTVNLSRALGSFLDVYHKCSVSTEKTKDILTSLDKNFYTSTRSSAKSQGKSPTTAGVSNPTGMFAASSLHADASSIRSVDGPAGSVGSRSRSPSPTSRVGGSPLATTQDILSHKKSQKQFTFASTPTMRGGMNSPSTGQKSPVNGTWSEALTPPGYGSPAGRHRPGASSSIAAKMTGLSGNRRSLGTHGTPHLLESDSSMAKDFFRADPVAVKIAQANPENRYASPTNGSNQAAEAMFPGRKSPKSNPASHSQPLSNSLGQRSEQRYSSPLKHQDTHSRLFVAGDATPVRPSSGPQPLGSQLLR